MCSSEQSRSPWASTYVVNPCIGAVSVQLRVLLFLCVTMFVLLVPCWFVLFHRVFVCISSVSLPVRSILPSLSLPVDRVLIRVSLLLVSRACLRYESFFYPLVIRFSSHCLSLFTLDLNYVPCWLCVVISRSFSNLFALAHNACWRFLPRTFSSFRVTCFSFLKIDRYTVVLTFILYLRPSALCYSVVIVRSSVTSSVCLPDGFFAFEWSSSCLLFFCCHLESYSLSSLFLILWLLHCCDESIRVIRLLLVLFPMLIIRSCYPSDRSIHDTVWYWCIHCWCSGILCSIDHVVSLLRSTSPLLLFQWYLLDV